MSEGLLVRLRRYKSREGRDSLEDFVTEAFAWLLESEPDFQDAFLELVGSQLEKNGASAPISRGDSVSWQTQEVFEDCRFDLVARLPEALLIFENKVWAGSAQSQIDNYLDATHRLAPTLATRVLMITANRSQHRNAHACLCWEDVYRLIDRHQGVAGNGTESDRYLQDFQALLLHEGLGPHAPVSHQALSVYPVTRHLPSDLQRLFGALAHRDWSFFESYRFRGHENRLGRIGLAFGNTNGWSPGFLVVCVLDGSDLRIDDRLEKGLKLHIIPSFRRSLHARYPRLEGYRQFKDDLKEITATTDWTLYDQLEEKPKPNRYHPLHIEYSLIELFRGTQEMDEQVNQVYSIVAQFLKAILAKDGLRALTRGCETE